MGDRDWTVLLIGGHSASGKTVVAERIGLSLGIPWIMADDLRLAFQRSRARLPGYADTLYFDKEPGYWQRPAQEQCDALIAVGEALSSALEVVVENHVDQTAPCVIEGADVLPALLSRTPLQERREAVRAAFLVEPDEAAILASVVERGREFAGRAAADLAETVRARWLFGQWLAREAARHRLPVIDPRPWDTLAERIVEQAA